MQTEYKIVYEGADDAVHVITPAPEFMDNLMKGGIVRNQRWIADDAEGKPVLDGTGEALTAMTEQEAIEFIAWKDVPVSVQIDHATGNRQRIFLCHQSQLPNRTFRDAWRLRQ